MPNIVHTAVPALRARRPPASVFVTPTHVIPYYQRRGATRPTIIDMDRYLAVAWIPRRIFLSLPLRDIENILRLCRRKLTTETLSDGTCFIYPYFPSEHETHQENLLWRAFNDLAHMHLPHWELTLDQVRRIFYVD